MPESGPAGVLHPSWHRVVLKLSGGLFAGAEPLGISPDVVAHLAAEIIAGSLDRLGVCNRLNLLLIHEAAWGALLPVALEALRAGGVTASLPPHDHALGHEWALDEGHEATVTVAANPILPVT